MKITVESSVASLGPYATPTNLSAMGWTLRQIEAAVRRGTLAWKRDGGLETTALYAKGGVGLGRKNSGPPRGGKPSNSPIAYYVDDHNVIRSTAQPAAPGFTHHLVGNVVQVIADDDESAFEYQAWFDRAALEEAIGGSGSSHARKKKIDPHEVKQHLQAAGVDFSRDFHELPSSAVDLILTAARGAGYRKRKDAPGSTARMYFQHLSRLRHAR